MTNPPPASVFRTFGFDAQKQFTLHMVGEPNHQYEVDFSLDLKQWIPLASLLSSSNGQFQLVIHWRYDPATPRGPNMEIRPRPEQIVSWGLKAGLTVTNASIIDLPPWHYGIRFRRS